MSIKIITTRRWSPRHPWHNSCLRQKLQLGAHGTQMRLCYPPGLHCSAFIQFCWKMFQCGRVAGVVSAVWAGVLGFIRAFKTIKLSAGPQLASVNCSKGETWGSEPFSYWIRRLSVLNVIPCVWVSTSPGPGSGVWWWHWQWHCVSPGGGRY